MYRFLTTPKWIAFHLVVVVAIVAMINLGLWQLRRLDDRREFNATVEERYDAPPQPIDEVLTGSADPDDVEWRPVTASGTYRPDAEILVVNRSQNTRAGDNSVVPLLFDDGRVLLVNRGFAPLGVDVPPPPEGPIDVLGRLRTSEERRLGQLSDPSDGVLEIAQRIDIDRLTPQLDELAPGDVVPMYIDLIESRPTDTEPFPEPVTPPDLSEGNHLSYAVQWFIFSLAVAAGWFLAVRHSARSRAARRQQAAA